MQAQLAITEAMTEAALETYPGFSRPDYWELTNFGTNDVPLDGYSFADSRGTNLIVRYPFTNLVIHPSESIIFFRVQPDKNTVTNEQRFREWWGESNLRADLQFRTYESPGLDGQGGDELWLFDPQLNVLDHVVFGEAWTGRAFAYDSDTGVFGIKCLPGGKGVFKAALGDDYGSPGTNIGPVGLRFTAHPADEIADLGGEATFTVTAVGMPPPKYQWLSNGVEIVGANDATLTLQDVQLSAAGNYSVRITNGLAQLTSYEAALTVNTNPCPPIIIKTPMDMTVFPDQQATFSVKVRGIPAPHYQWESNGVPIAGATQSTLIVAGPSLGTAPIRYSVQISNDLGSTNTSALLTVIRRPLLRITEVMASPLYADSSAHYDWFELTNYETNSVNLLGYRFFDTYSFKGAFTITNVLILQPDESVIFVEEMSPESFRNWWGASNLKPGLQIYTYHGFSLSDSGEQIYLWNPAATDLMDTVSSTSWAMALRGVSLECTNWCDENYGCMGECLEDSVLGRNGAFVAVSNGDIGSPGYTANPPAKFLSIQFADGEIILAARVIVGRTYRLSCSPNLPGSWTELGLYYPEEAILYITQAMDLGTPTRFYRLEEVF